MRKRLWQRGGCLIVAAAGEVDEGYSQRAKVAQMSWSGARKGTSSPQSDAARTRSRGQRYATAESLDRSHVEVGDSRATLIGLRPWYRLRLQGPRRRHKGESQCRLLTEYCGVGGQRGMAECLLCVCGSIPMTLQQWFHR